MKRNLGFYAFCTGLLLLVVQFLIILFSIVNGDYINAEPFAVMDASQLNGPGFVEIIKSTWSGIFGTLLLIAMLVRRFIKGPDTAMVLVGVMLWVIQILTLRVQGDGVVDLLKSYPMGFVGLGIVLISLVADIYFMRSSSSRKEENNK